MSAVSRRTVLQAGIAGAAALAAGPAARAENKPASTPRFRLGMVTYNVAAAWDVPTIIKVCQATGIGPVELRTTHKHMVEPSLSKDERKAVKKRFADGGVDIWGCGSVCEFQSPDPEVVKKNIETCKAFVELAADIGGRGVKVRPNGLPAGVPVEKTLEQIGKALIPCGQAAADAGVEIWVEVHGRGTAHPPYIKTIMEHCGHKSVGLTWNSNPEDVKAGSVAEYFKLLQPWIRSCHINDLYKDSTGDIPLSRAVRPAARQRLRSRDAVRSWPHLPRAGRRHRVPALLQGAVD